MSEAMLRPDLLANARQVVVGEGIRAALSGLSAGARFFHPKAQPWRRGVLVSRDIPYQDRQRQAGAHLLDIYRPDNAEGPLPVLFYVHGGGFRILSKDSHWMFGCGFARMGFLVVSINYTLSGTAPFPKAVQDTFAAWQWTLDHIEEYGGDLSRVVVAGESAGANLATDVALAACWKQPEPWARRVFDAGVVPVGCMPACGMMQVSDADRYLSNSSIPTWMRDRIAQICRTYLPDTSGERARFELADPLCFLEETGEPERPLPAFLVTCGTKDPILEDSVRLEKALQRLPCEAEAHWYEGAGHAFHAFFWAGLAPQWWAHTEAFCKRVALA
jgi:acetyl esterase